MHIEIGHTKRRGLSERTDEDVDGGAERGGMLEDGLCEELCADVESGRGADDNPPFDRRFDNNEELRTPP